MDEVERIRNAYLKAVREAISLECAHELAAVIVKRAAAGDPRANRLLRQYRLDRELEKAP